MADDDIGASLSLSGARQRIAVVGTGISGLSAAWLLAQRHDVTVYEQAGRAGGHSCTLPTPEERALLGAFRTSRNLVVLHTDASLMPRRKRAWASWNYLGTTGAPGTQDAAPPCVTYWMNNLQGIAGPDLFVTLNPPSPPCPGRVIHSRHFDHPMFDIAAIEAQRRLWTLQGVRRTWFAGAWFGAGFHEDGLQAGLAAAEDIGGVRRPWSVPDESGRIHLAPAAHRRLPELTA